MINGPISRRVGVTPRSEHQSRLSGTKFLQTDSARALTASVDSCAEIKSAPSDSGVNKSGRVCRKLPERGARSVGALPTVSPPPHSLSTDAVSALCRQRPLGEYSESHSEPNSKHWFTTSSFLQPLPYLVTP